jgi:hypothetical protein
MDKDAIMEWVEENYNDLLDRYNELIIDPADQKIPEFYEFAENEAINSLAGKEAMAYEEWKEDPDRIDN